MKTITCKMYRGGTSKGIVLDGSLLPYEKKAWDHVLLALMGGADPKQIDGLGGAVTTSSKVAIVTPSERPGIDVDYTFAQVVVGKGKVDYRANCGNMSSTVGPFAIEQGWVQAQAGETAVRIYNTNTDKIIVAHVPTDGTGVVYEGDYAIAGVPGTGGRITLEFKEPQGASTGKLLPTGNPADVFEIPEIGQIKVSVVDAANLFVFVPATEVGLQGNETIAQLQKMEGLAEKLEWIRGMAAQKLGYVSDYHSAKEESVTVPKLMIVGKPMAYETSGGARIDGQQMDIQARMISAMKPHPTMAMTGAMCLAAAAAVNGSVVSDIASCEGEKIERSIMLAHPGGLMDVGILGERDAGHEAGVRIEAAVGYRTARLMMAGTAYYKDEPH